MSIYEKAIKYYNEGLWSAERIDALYQAGKLTKEERDSILGIN